MNWKDNIRQWRSLSPAQQQQLSLARSPVQVWQSMAFEREPVSLLWLQAQHVRPAGATRSSNFAQGRLNLPSCPERLAA